MITEKISLKSRDICPMYGGKCFIFLMQWNEKNTLKIEETDTAPQKMKLSQKLRHLMI